MLGVKPGVDASAKSKRDIERALPQVDDCQIGRDMQFDVRIRRPEPVQARGQPAGDM